MDQVFDCCQRVSLLEKYSSQLIVALCPLQAAAVAALLVMLDLRKNMSRECSGCWHCIKLQSACLVQLCPLRLLQAPCQQRCPLVHVKHGTLHGEHNVHCLGLPHLCSCCRNSSAGPHSKPAKKGCCGGQSAVKHEHNNGYQQAPGQGQPVQGYPAQQQQTVGQLPPGKVV